MNKHTHEWKLIDSYDSWKVPITKLSLPKGQFVPKEGFFGGTIYIGPSVSDINRYISRVVVENIRKGDEPHYSSETWVCSCSKRKTNSRIEKSVNESLFGRNLNA